MGARLGAVLVGIGETLLHHAVGDDLRGPAGSRDVAFGTDGDGAACLLELRYELAEPIEAGLRRDLVFAALRMVRTAACASSGLAGIADDATPALRLITAI